MHLIDGSLPTDCSQVIEAQTLALGIPGGWEWIVILLVVLIFFGNRIPGMARSLGSGINEFKSGLKEGQSDVQNDSGKSSSSTEKTNGSHQQSSGGEGS